MLFTGLVAMAKPYAATILSIWAGHHRGVPWQLPVEVWVRRARLHGCVGGVHHGTPSVLQAGAVAGPPAAAVTPFRRLLRARRVQVYRW